ITRWTSRRSRELPGGLRRTRRLPRGLRRTRRLPGGLRLRHSGTGVVLRRRFRRGGFERAFGWLPGHVAFSERFRRRFRRRLRRGIRQGFATAPKRVSGHAARSEGLRKGGASGWHVPKGVFEGVSERVFRTDFRRGFRKGWFR